MDKVLKAAIVGYGKMGRIRAACIAENPHLRLVAVCDVHLPGDMDDLPGVSDYKDILKFSPDLVFICLPNCEVAATVSYFLDRKVHVFCEKPPGKSKNDVEMMLAAEKRNPGIKLKFGFNHRYHQAVLDAKAIIDKGRLGSILWLRGVYGKAGGNSYEKSWRNDKDISGGGILIDQGIHMVDLFRLFCGEFVEVKSFINTLYWPVNVEDNAFALLRNKKQQVAMLHSSATQWAHKFSLDIYLQKGYLSISGILSSTRTYGIETLKIARCLYDKDGYPLPNPDETVNYYEDDHSWRLETEEFTESIIHDSAIKVGTCKDAYDTMALIEQIYQSDMQSVISRSCETRGGVL